MFDTLAVSPPHPRCLSVTGVVGNIVYRVRHTGGWELYPRGKPDAAPLYADTAATFAEAWRAAKDKADALFNKRNLNPM